MNGVMREHALSLFRKGTRADGRKLDEYRKVSVEYDVSKSAEGSARVRIGDTEVVAGVKVEIGTPFPDRPDEGTIIVNTELLPLSSPEFESGPPGINAIELSRVVDRVIRESGYVDFKKLCVEKGEKVWLVLIDIYPLNDRGNLFDAVALAALAALKNTRFPEFDGERIDYKKKTDKKLPLKEIPLSCTVLKIGDHLLVDPTNEEILLTDARLTVGMLGDKLCALQKGGDFPLSDKDVEAMLNLAFKKSKELKKVIEK